MARDTIFKCNEAMPPTSNSPDVYRAALSFEEFQVNHRPAIMPIAKKDVANIERPVRGRPY
jgi:hypothetical protein